MIDYYKRDIKKGTIKKLDNFSKDCWIDVVNPSEDEINFLVNKFKLDNELILDGLDINEVPRIEEETGIIYFYVRIPTFKIENEYTGSFLLIISNDFFMTVSDSRLEIFDRLFKTNKNFFNNKSTKALLEVLLILTSKFSYWIRNILKEVKKNRRNIKFLNENDIYELVVQEDILNDYLSSLDPLIHLHSAMLRCKSIKFKEDEKEFIEDIIVDLNQTLNLCISSLKTMTNMRDYYSTTLSNNRNNILRILTFFTVFLTVPMVLSGIYGMNIDLPLQNHKEVFYLLSGLVILIWIFALIVLRRAKVV